LHLTIWKVQIIIILSRKGEPERSKTMSTPTRPFKVTRDGSSSLLSWEETEAELRKVIDSLALPAYAPDRRPARRGGMVTTAFAGSDHLFRYIRGIVIQGSYYKIAGVTFQEVKAAPAPAPAFRELTVEPDEDAEDGTWNAWQ
jgi:hypothetical protein